MKLLTTLTLVLFTQFSMAHEGGHGEVSEGGKFGGVTSPIVASAHAGKAHKKEFLFKGELVRNESGELSLYIFNNKMELMDLAAFSETVEARIEVKKKGKFTDVGTFNLKRNGTHFKGQLPKVEYRPFNIDIYLMKGKEKLFVGFSNLD
jgi:hypothetical protein